MEVELTDHLGYEPHREPPGGAGNTRNWVDSEDTPLLQLALRGAGEAAGQRHRPIRARPLNPGKTVWSVTSALICRGRHPAHACAGTGPEEWAFG